MKNSVSTLPRGNEVIKIMPCLAFALLMTLGSCVKKTHHPHIPWNRYTIEEVKNISDTLNIDTTGQAK